jgi:hypothetical protein
MVSSLSVILLAAVASAGPLAPRFIAPPTSKSHGFTLIANISRPSDLEDPRFAPLANHLPVATMRYGLGPLDSFPVVGNFEAGPSIFWLNDTKVGLPRAEVEKLPSYERSDVISDSGVEWADVMSIERVGKHEQKVSFARNEMNFGFQVSFEPYNLRQLFYPRGPFFIYGLYACVRSGSMVSYDLRVYGTDESIGPNNPPNWVPDTCVQIELAVQCAKLPPLGPLATYDRKTAVEVPCYDDVASIDWKEVFGQ